MYGSDLRPFQFWCQKVLPVVYDDSLSYYEVLCKVVEYLNKTIKEVNAQGKDISALEKLVVKLREYVDNYFDSLDVKKEIENKLDQMASDGTLTKLIGDQAMLWNCLDKYSKLPLGDIYKMYNGYSQGMAGDGTYLYLTHRNTLDNQEAFSIAKILKSNMTVVADAVVSSGHYNNLCYYNGRLYASGGATSESTSDGVDYYKVAVIDAQTLNLIKVISMPYQVWGIGIYKPYDIAAPVVVDNPASTSCFTYYTGFSGGHEENVTASDGSVTKVTYKPKPEYRVPLCRITASNGVGIWQGSFHLSNRFIFAVWSELYSSTPYANNGIAVYDYNGRLVHVFYLPDTVTQELQDVWVSDDYTELWVNTARCEIHKYSIKKLYGFYLTGLNYRWTLNSALKNFYANGNPIDSYRSFTYQDKTYKIFNKHMCNEITYSAEIQNLHGYGFFNRVRFDLFPATENKILYGHCTFTFSGGSSIDVRVQYRRRENRTNYYFELSSLTVVAKAKDGSTVEFWSGDISNGDLNANPNTEGSIAWVVNKMATGGWLLSDFYINRLYYTVGVPFEYKSLPSFQ